MWFMRLSMRRFSGVLRLPAQYPAVRDALLWAIPALLFGAALRLMFLHYSPYAYWGSDSRSYYDFTHKLFVDYDLSLVEKRRFLYPIVMAAVTLLPGVPLQWVAWLQHGFGLLTLVPLAYVVRKNFSFWRWWVVPVTVVYAGLPVVLWYEHELLGETLFFALVVWAFAGWTAWIKEARLERATRLWWCFFVPFALFMLTKPSGRFYWPGLLLGVVAVAAWRRMKWLHVAALGALMIVTLLLGSKTQGAWLFYVAAFPLTQLDTPLHANYKAQIRDLVEQARRDLHVYYTRDDEVFLFTRNPALHPHRTLWVEMGKRDPQRTRIHMDLALEGVKAEPLTFLYLGLQRAVVSANLSAFNDVRFRPEHVPTRFRDDYEDALQRLREGRRTPIPLALGYPIRGPLPPFEEIAHRFSPDPGSFSTRAVMAWVKGYRRAADLIRMPANGTLAQARPTALGWWLIAAMLLALLPAYRSTFGVWTVAALGYIVGVFLVSQANPRYFGAAWPVLVPLLAVPADAVCRAAARRLQRQNRLGNESPAGRRS